MTLRNGLPYYFRAVPKLAPPHYPQFGQLGPLFLDVKKLFCLISSNITITMRTHLWTLFIMMMFGCLCGDMNKQSECALCIGSSQCLITDSHGPSLPVHLSWFNKKACMESSCTGSTCMAQHSTLCFNILLPLLVIIISALYTFELH